MVWKIRKEKRPKGPKGQIKIGDTVAYTTQRRIEFGVVVAVAKSWKLICVKFSDGQNWDCCIDYVVPESLYTHKHHQLLLGVTP